MSEQETSGSAYAELAGRLADLFERVGQHAERLLDDAEAEADRILNEARAEAARISHDAREEADRVLSELRERREAMIQNMRLVESRMARATSEVEAMIEAFDTEADDQDVSTDTAALNEEADSPLVIPEGNSAENEAAPASPSEVNPSMENKGNGKLSVYMALWGLDQEGNKPEGSTKR
jgi:cell division septum initiation protein DivIVA